MEIPLSNGVVLSSSVGFELQPMVIEAAIVATKSVAWLVMMICLFVRNCSKTALGRTLFLILSMSLVFLQTRTVPNGIHVLIKEPEAYAGFPLALLAVRKPGLENKDADDTEDDDEEEEENEYGGDEDEDAGEEEDGSGKDAEGEDGEDPEDEPEANGDGASGDEDDEDDDDDDDDDNGGDDDGGEDEEEEEEEEEEDEEEEEEELQPPAKKQK